LARRKFSAITKSRLLHYIFQPQDDYSQHRWVTEMARLASTQFAADWVINADADEFWLAAAGRPEANACERPPVVPRRPREQTNFIPHAMQSPEFFADAMTLRTRRSLNLLGARSLGKVCHRGCADIVVATGQPSCLRRRQGCARGRCEVTILHFPLRSFNQFENKIVKGGAAYARNQGAPDRQRGHLAAHVRALAEGRARSGLPRRAL